MILMLMTYSSIFIPRNSGETVEFSTYIFFSIFFFFSKKLPIVVVRDVCPSVCVNNFLISNRPECPLGGGACPKGVIFRNSNCKLQICAICNFLQINLCARF